MRTALINAVTLVLLLLAVTVLLTGDACEVPPYEEPSRDACEVPPYEEPSRDALWHAICQVESGGDPDAWHEGEKAAGIAQIRPIMVRDVNRILREDRYEHLDAFDPRLAREMFDIYIDHYWRAGTAEQHARAWNGGPRGPSKAATLPYWRKVQQHLD